MVEVVGDAPKDEAPKDEAPKDEAPKDVGANDGVAIGLYRERDGARWALEARWALGVRGG